MLMRIYETPSQQDWLRKTKTIRLGNGLNMGYVEAGDPSKETLLCIHGMADSSRNWRGVMQKLQNDYHIYAVDQRGFGMSDKPSEYAYTATELAGDVKLFMEAMGIEKAYIAGHSMGSMVAQTVAFQYSEKVLGLILISTFAHMHETPETMDAQLNEFASLNIAQMSDEELQTAFLGEPLPATFEPEFVPGFIDSVKLITGESMLSGWRAMSINDNRNFLHHIKAPVMIIWGTEDTIFTGEYQDELRVYLPDAEYLTYEGASHDILNEDPYRAAKDIKEFIRKIKLKYEG